MEATVKSKSVDKSRWIAIDKNNKIIAENTNPNTLVKKAEKISTEYTLQYVPDPNRSYIF